MTRTDDQAPGAGPAPPGATETSLGGQLVVVATPIGNLGDITARALDTLRTAALIACEDTRTTGKLLHRFGIDTKMAPYHEHNAEWARPKILETLRRADGGAGLRRRDAAGLGPGLPAGRLVWKRACGSPPRPPRAGRLSCCRPALQALFRRLPAKQVRRPPQGSRSGARFPAR